MNKPFYKRLHRTSCDQRSTDCIEVEQLIGKDDTCITIREKDGGNEMFVQLNKQSFQRFKEALAKFE